MGKSKMSSKINYPSITLPNGKTMPQFGLGTWLSEPGQVKAAVEHAIDIGYRHIDCAYCYQNQNEVGEAIKNKISQGIIKREDLFITTKLWNTYFRKENMREGLEANYNELGLDYIDLILLHWPTAFKLNEYKEIMPFKDLHDNSEEVSPVNVWTNLVNLFKSDDYKNRLGAIGVSNYNVAQLKALKKNCDYQPDMNQYEGHPYLVQKELSDYCKNNKIPVTNYSPLGNPSIGDWETNKGKARLLDNETVKNLAEKYNKDAGAILIKFCLQRGHVCIPKSVTPKRIESNSNVFDFEISDEDMKALEDLNGPVRYCVVPDWKQNVNFPF